MNGQVLAVVVLVWAVVVLLLIRRSPSWDDVAELVAEERDETVAAALYAYDVEADVDAPLWADLRLSDQAVYRSLARRARLVLRRPEDGQ